MNITIFRIISYLEGISFLVLLLIAMPLKYAFDLPMWVTVVGAIHGFLFVAYVLDVFVMMFDQGWSIKKAFLAVVASVLPLGPFIFDRKLLHGNQGIDRKAS